MFFMWAIVLKIVWVERSITTYIKKDIQSINKKGFVCDLTRQKFLGKIKLM